MKSILLVFLTGAGIVMARQICTPNSQFKNYCNTCGCSADGLSLTCTKMLCDPDIWNEDGSLTIHLDHLYLVKRSADNKMCTPRSHFNDYCNTCGCAEDGLSFICTKMQCDLELWNQDGSLKTQENK